MVDCCFRDLWTQCFFTLTLSLGKMPWESRQVVRYSKGLILSLGPYWGPTNCLEIQRLSFFSMSSFKFVLTFRGHPSMLTLPPQAYVYPETSTNERALANVLGKLNAVLRTGAPGQHRLTGHQFGKPEIGRPMAFATWASSLPAGEEILSIIPGPPGSAASLGKVLGNRTTLYKYLNPHIFAVTTASPNTCGVYVVDGAKGSIVYHTSIAARQGAEGCDLHATFVENWLVYVYWEEQYQWAGQTKGRRLVTVELYEGSKPDDKTKRCVSAFETRYTTNQSPVRNCRPIRTIHWRSLPSSSLISFLTRSRRLPQRPPGMVSR